MVKEIGVRKFTICFKINLIKMLDKYPKLKEVPALSHLSDKGIKYTINSRRIAIGWLLEI